MRSRGAPSASATEGNDEQRSPLSIFDPTLIGLGVAAFLAATILPFSSEAALLAALAAGAPPLPAWIWASVGNCLGAMSSYLIGRLYADRARTRLERSPSGRRALDWARRYGGWTLLGSWLPVIGDPLLLAAGLFRFRWWQIVLLGLGTRVARYGLVIAAT